MPSPARNCRSSPISTRSVCRSAYLSEAPGWLRAVKRVSCKTGRSSPLVVVFLAVIALGFLLPASAQTTIFNCSSGFSSSGACQVGVFSGGPFEVLGTQNGSSPALSGTSVLLASPGAEHTALSMIYQTPVAATAFTTTFTFVPDGQSLAFVVQNNNGGGTFGGAANFSSGAGCEAGFYQAFVPPNAAATNIFALLFDSTSSLTESGSFSYSSVQIYQQYQSPCNPNDSGPGYWSTTKFSTSPVPLNSPATTPNTSTGDTYSATVTYDGSNVILNMYDVTAGGSCPGASCFTREWSDVSIPSLVNGTTAYVGFTEGTGTVTSSFPLYVRSWSYTVNSPTATPGSTPPVAGGTPAANPTYSPAAGAYSGAQTVTISDATSGANICYTLGASGLTIMPLPNNLGGCAVGTPYTGPVTISSNQTLYAIAGTNATGLPSGIVQGAYSIGSETAVATPTFSPGAGTYASAQSVTLSDATSGVTIYYTTDGSTPTTSSTVYTGPITVSSTETLKAIAAVTGDPSAVASAAYTITPAVSTPTFSPAAGAYTSAQSVTISDATSGATIYYTTNGTTPTTASTVYAGPITVSSTETLEAIAVATGDTNSAVASVTYTITPTVSTPAFSPAAGTYTSAQSVTISDATSGATIYYTTNGTTPTTASTRVRRAYYGKLDGDAGSNRGSHGRHQQRGCVGHLHHHAHGLNAGLLTCCRDLHLRTIGDHL